MKYLIPIFCSLFLLISCDDLSLSEDQSDKFVKYYNAGLNDMGKRVIVTDNGYLILGNMLNINGQSDICLIRTDKFGNTLGSANTYGGAFFNDFANNIYENEDGYLIIGSSYTTNSNYSPQLIQVDKTGAETWSKVFATEIAGNSEVFDAVLHEDGTISLIGYRVEENGSTRDILYIKYDPEADVTEMDTWGKSLLNEEAKCMMQLSNDLFLVGGYTEEKGASQNIKKLFLAKWRIGTTGVLPLYIEDEKSINTTAIDISAGIGGGFVAACETENNVSREIKLIKTNNAIESVEWFRTLGERDFNSVSEIKTIDNRYYLSGTSSNSLNSGDMMIIDFDQQGSGANYCYFGDGETYIGGGFSLTSDNGYIITGGSYFNENSVITIFKNNAKTSF